MIFTRTLPLLKDSLVTQPSSVLVAEDVKPVRIKLVESLRQLGFDPIAVADGQAALSTFAEHQPPIVLLDIAMPGIDGLEVCRRIRRMNAETLIVMVTADTRPSVVREAVLAGANDFIGKPFDLERLRTAFERLLEAA